MKGHDGDTGMGASRTLGTGPPRVTTGPWPSLPAAALFHQISNIPYEVSRLKVELQEIAKQLDIAKNYDIKDQWAFNEIGDV